MRRGVGFWGGGIFYRGVVLGAGVVYAASGVAIVAGGVIVHGGASDGFCGGGRLCSLGWGTRCGASRPGGSSCDRISWSGVGG